MGRRTLLLIAAFVVAALGSTLIFLYVRGVDDRALEGQEPLDVLVAKAEIAAGTTGAAAEAAGAFELKQIAKASVADGAISSTESIANLVALAPIFPGEQILATKFGAAATGALPIGDGQVAVSLQLSDPARVAGFVGPGSEVAVILRYTEETDSETPKTWAKTLLPRAQVIAAGQSTLVTQTKTTPAGEETTEQIPRAILTLTLSEADMLKLVLAQGTGELTFALLNDSSQTTKGAGVETGTLFR